MRGAANTVRAAGVLLAVGFPWPAQAGCQDSPGPRVNWTGCSRNLLMLGGDDLTEAVLARAVLTSTDFRRAKLPKAKLNEAEVSFVRFGNATVSEISCVGSGGCSCSGHGSCEALAEEDGELSLGHTPLSCRHGPLFLRPVQDQEQQL